MNAKGPCPSHLVQTAAMHELCYAGCMEKNHSARPGMELGGEVALLFINAKPLFFALFIPSFFGTNMFLLVVPLSALALF